MTEPMYTREDMARARQEGRAEGWDEGYRARGADIIYTSLSGDPSDTPNPYREQEEA